MHYDILSLRESLLHSNSFLIAVFLLSMVGEKHGSTSFRKKLKLSRISFETAGTYRVVAKGKYCQFEKNVEVRVISKYSSLPKPRLNLRYNIIFGFV